MYPKHVTRFFDRDDYNEVMKNVEKDKVNHYMVGLQAIKQYLGAIRIIFNMKKLQGLANIEKSALTTNRWKNFIKLVGKRKERVNISNLEYLVGRSLVVRLRRVVRYTPYGSVRDRSMDCDSRRLGATQVKVSV